MEIEEEIVQEDSQTAKELNTTFIIMLCLLFYCLFRLFIAALHQLFKVIIPDIAVIGIQPYFLNLVWFLWCIYGFWSIILSLKGSKASITCLKLFLPFFFASFLISNLTKLSTFSFGMMLIPLMILLFPLIFFIYLCKSKEIKQSYPKETRKIGVPGFIGIILYVVIIAIFTQAFVSGASSAIRGRRVDTDKVKLYDNEITDGRSIFKPRKEWELDSVQEHGYLGPVYCFHNPLIDATIRISCTKEEYEPSRHYYIYSITEDRPFQTVNYIDALNFKQEESEEFIIYVDQYEYQIDSALYYWTYASKLSKKGDKGIRYSIVEKDTMTTSVSDIMDFMNSTTFDIRSRLFKKDGID